MSVFAFDDGPALLQLMFSPDVALWPGAALRRVGLSLSWAAVLCAGVAWLLRAQPPRWRAAALVCVAGACIWPGPVSPTYWLGLAFQSPSLMSLALSLIWIWGQLRPGLRLGTAPSLLRAAAPIWVLAAAVLLGWSLLLDTLAVWPLELYRAGRMPITIWLAALGFALLGLCAAPATADRRWAGLLWVVLALHVLTRLPTGNCWDALLDPGLWLLAHLALGQRAWACWRFNRAGA